MVSFQTDKSQSSRSSSEAPQIAGQSFFSSLASFVFSPEKRAAILEERRTLKDQQNFNSACATQSEKDASANLQSDGFDLEKKKLKTHATSISNPKNFFTAASSAEPGIGQILSSSQLRTSNYLLLKGHSDPDKDSILKSASGLGGLSQAGVAMVFSSASTSMDALKTSMTNLAGKTSPQEISNTFAHNELVHANLIRDAKFLKYLEAGATNQDDINKAINHASAGALRRPIETFEFLSDAASISYNRGDIARVLSNSIAQGNGIKNATPELSYGYVGTNRLVDQAVLAYAAKSGRSELAADWEGLKEKYQKIGSNLSKKQAQEHFADLEKFTAKLGEQGARFIQAAYKNHAKEVLKIIDQVKLT